MGQDIITLSGKKVKLPKANEQPCFMVRKGCKNMATWRMDSDHFVFHFCDQCKAKDVFKDDNPIWTKLD